MAHDAGSLDDGTLVRSLFEKQRALVRSRFAHSMNRLENTASLGALRREIARVQTEIRRRELAAGLPKDELLRKHPVDIRTVESGEAKGKAEGGLLAGVVDKLGG
jgi:large subunit ribosomal protein L29